MTKRVADDDAPAGFTPVAGRGKTEVSRMTIWDEILTGAKEMDMGRLWQLLDADTRLLAAHSFYQHDFEDGGVQHLQADAMIAAALNFRLVAARKLPVERKARSVALLPRPTPELVAMILIALHFENRRGLMSRFLDSLGIEHKDGLIPPDHGAPLADNSRLAEAIDGLFGSFPPDQVDLYLAALYLGDRENWGSIRPAMSQRRASAER
jgi:hypothetical protein